MTTPECPYCNSTKTVEITYGLVDIPELNGPDDVYLGGCVINPDSPDRHCNNCGKDYGIFDEFDAE
jgi:hypothetical protein